MQVVTQKHGEGAGAVALANDPGQRGFQLSPGSSQLPDLQGLNEGVREGGRQAVRDSE